MAYKTSYLPPSASSVAIPAGYQTRFSHGLSEHERCLEASAVARIGSDPNLTQPPQDVAPHLEDADEFQDAMSNHGGQSARTTTTSVPHGTPATPAAMQGRAGGVVPNGYHFTLGVNSGAGPGGRGAGRLREQEEDNWC